MTATRQQRGVQAQPLNVRVSPDLIKWLRAYAYERGISVNMAAAEAIEALKNRSSIKEQSSG